MLEVRKKENNYSLYSQGDLLSGKQNSFIPESISLLVNNGYEIIIEAGAGAVSNIQTLTLVKPKTNSVYS